LKRLVASEGQATESNYNYGVRLEALCAFVVSLLTLASAIGCSASGPAGGAEAAGVKATYSTASGRLELITYDTNKDGKVDAWSRMDGTRLVSMEIDRDFDGIVDRWEHYSAGGALEKVGFSCANDGKADAWAYQGDNGRIARIEVSTNRDGKVNRVEFYETGALARAEEDTNGDGKPDKRETYRAGALASVELDTNHDGRPDRLLTYGPDGVKAEKLR
jgi:hypothetical protein